jgi:hypothetical protein
MVKGHRLIRVAIDFLSTHHNLSPEHLFQYDCMMILTINETTMSYKPGRIAR